MNTANEMTYTLTMPIYGAYVTIDARDIDLMQHRWYTTQAGQVFRTAPRRPDGTREGRYLVREVAKRLYGPLDGRRVRVRNGNRLDLRRTNIELIETAKSEKENKR